MSIADMKELLEAGVHFGHQTKRWNPKMKKYIFGARNGIHILDLQITVKKLNDACKFVKDIVGRGEPVLFVGTKRQAQEIVESEAKRSSMFYVNRRWVGGMLTNFATIRKNVKRLEQLETWKVDGTYDRLTKKEIGQLEKKRMRQELYLGGIRDMTSIPGAVFIVDTRVEKIAVLEAKRLGLPIIAIMDTNCDPEDVEYVIPGNDDAIRSIKLISTRIADAAIEGLEVRAQRSAEASKPEAVPTQDLQMLDASTPPEMATANSTGEKDEKIEGGADLGG